MNLSVNNILNIVSGSSLIFLNSGLYMKMKSNETLSTCLKQISTLDSGWLVCLVHY